MSGKIPPSPLVRLTRQVNWSRQPGSFSSRIFDLPIARKSFGQYDGRMNLGFGEMVFIFGVALIIFGPKKLPEIGRQIGKALNEFKRASNEFKAQIEAEIAQIETKPQILPPEAPPLGTITARSAPEAVTAPVMTALPEAAAPDVMPEAIEFQEPLDVSAMPQNSLADAPLAKAPDA
jgi:sec-independent protein translocase protein TatB